MNILLDELLPGGGHWSFPLKRGQCLRLTDSDGGANLALLAFNALEKSERLNLPDSLKAQHTASLTTGHCLYSDMGRVLLAVVHDTLGWHDPLGGVSTAEEVQQRYGAGRYQDLHNACHRNGCDNLLVELGKWGLARRDLVMNLNLFSKVASDADGNIAFVPGHSPAGTQVSLLAPMDTLVVMTAIPHPMDPAPVYAPRPVRIELGRVEDLDAALAVCRARREENVRALQLTQRLYL